MHTGHRAAQAQASPCGDFAGRSLAEPLATSGAKLTRKVANNNNNCFTSPRQPESNLELGLGDVTTPLNSHMTSHNWRSARPPLPERYKQLKVAKTPNDL